MDKEGSEARWLRARALMHHWRLEDAIALFETLLDPAEAPPDERPAWLPAELHERLAACHFRLACYADAELHYGLAAEAQPDREEYRVKQRLSGRLRQHPSTAGLRPRNEPDGLAPPLIAIHNHFPGDLPSPRDRPLAYEVTRDRGLAAHADAIVYHIPSLPEAIPIPKRPGQVAVASSMESDVLYPLLQDQTFMAQFDVTMTYRRDATIWCSYVAPQHVLAMRRPPAPKTERAPAVCFVSNTSRTSYDRDGYMLELMRYLEIDSYGRALANRRLEEDRGRSTKLAVCARYKFTIAFENSISQDYVSEKFFDPLVVGSVPVYLGAHNIDAFAPADRCFIDATTFDGPGALAAHIKALDQDDEAYATYLAWRARPFRERFVADADLQRHDALCRLAQLLRSRRAGASQA